MYGRSRTAPPLCLPRSMLLCQVEYFEDTKSPWQRATAAVSCLETERQKEGAILNT
jgi:hypothetical protein